MRIALLSDVHANLPALDAVLDDAAKEGAQATWHLGDLVGYGPDPDEVIARLIGLGAKCVLGNHDAAAVGQMGIEDFNPVAAAAARWTAVNLGGPGRDFLRALPETERDGLYTRVHGTLREPLREYLVTYPAARAHFALQETPYSIVGHTHVPLLVRETMPGHVAAASPGDGETLDLGEDRCCINPGGVGQPRDGDPRACYALLDTEAGTVTFHRVPYDIATTQRRIRERGLPDALAARLALGR